jgi:hypothetical protein
MPNEPPDPLDTLILNMLRAVVLALETSPTTEMRAQVLALVQSAVDVSEQGET